MAPTLSLDPYMVPTWGLEPKMIPTWGLKPYIHIWPLTLNFEPYMAST